MSFPTVSIVVPAYNAAPYVGEAIESALAQTYPHREVVVIDDGSTDGSLDVIRSFGDRIRWESGPNRGACAARNRGIELARGELIQFLDADDLLKPHKLAKQVPLVMLDRSRIVYSDYETAVVDGAGLSPHKSPVYRDEDPVVFVLQKSGLQTSAPLHRKQQLLSVGGFRESLPCAQERDLHLRLACMGLTFMHLPEALYTLRWRNGSVSSDSVKVLDQHSNIAWYAHEMLRQREELSEKRAAALAGFLAADARRYLRLGLRERAEDYFQQAQRMHAQGGMIEAYSGKSRWLVRTIGPVLTERLAGWCWRVARNAARVSALWSSG